MAVGETTANECLENRQMVRVLDITTESKPFGIATWTVPESSGNFCDRGGRFGTHSSNENFTPIYYGRVLFIAHFNAGVRALDVRDPLQPREIGYYIPAVTEKTDKRCVGTGGEQRCKIAIQTNNVEVDDRGYIYIVDRANTGMQLLELTGELLSDAGNVAPELAGSRSVDRWSQDSTVFVARALQPARVMDVKVVEAEKRMHVVVADDQLSLAIGKGGQNARLAARLTGWKIDLISKSEEKKRQEVERASRVEVEKLELGEATTEKLISAGIETVQELIGTPLDKLVDIPGIGEKTAEKILSVANEYLAAHPPVSAEPAPAELEFTPEMESAGDGVAERAGDAAVAAPASEGGEHRG